MAGSVDQPTGAPVVGGREVVTRLLEALEQRQADALPALLTEDVVQITAFSPEGGLEPFERFEGRDAVIGHFTHVFGLFEVIRLERTGLFVSDDGTTVFVEALGDNRMAGSDKTYRNGYVFKFVLRDGRVAEMIEYFNSVTFARFAGEALG
jgi:ketosteroid isomerase-like protein